MVTHITTNPHPQSANRGYQKILIGIDYNNFTPKVFEEALQLAKANGSQLMIFYAIRGQMPGTSSLPLYVEMTGYDAIYSPEMAQLEEKLIQESIEELQAWLKTLTQQAIAQGLTVESDYSYGDPGQKICALAKEWEADLIVVGRRGRSGLSELFLGSVSNYVIHHAPCSVLVIQP